MHSYPVHPWITHGWELTNTKELTHFSIIVDMHFRYQLLRSLSSLISWWYFILRLCKYIKLAVFLACYSIPCLLQYIHTNGRGIGWIQGERWLQGERWPLNHIDWRNTQKWALYLNTHLSGEYKMASNLKEWEVYYLILTLHHWIILEFSFFSLM